MTERAHSFPLISAQYELRDRRHCSAQSSDIRDTCSLPKLRTNFARRPVGKRDHLWSQVYSSLFLLFLRVSRTPKGLKPGCKNAGRSRAGRWAERQPKRQKTPRCTWLSSDATVQFDLIKPHPLLHSHCRPQLLLGVAVANIPSMLA